MRKYAIDNKDNKCIYAVVHPSKGQLNSPHFKTPLVIALLSAAKRIRLG